MGKDTVTNKTVTNDTDRNNNNEKIKRFLKKNALIIVLILLSAGAITANYYDKNNSKTINVTVDPKLAE